MPRKMSGKALAIFLIVVFALSSLSAIISVVRGGNRPDLLIVYDSATEQAAKRLASLFKQMYNMSVELVPAKDVKVRFRAYPVVLLAPGFDRRKLLSSGLVAYVTRGPGNAPMLPYELVLQLAARAAAQGNNTIATPYHILASGVIYIVEGESPVARINRTLFVRMLPLVARLAELFFAVNTTLSVSILNVTEAVHEGIPVSALSVLPAIIVESDYNLSRGTISVIPLGHGYYALAPPVSLQVAQLLVQAGLVEGYERLLPPPDTKGLVRYGSGNTTVKAVVYWDYLCPFSALFARSTLSQLVRLADNGTVTLYFADLLIHPQAFKLHSMAHCVYKRYGAKKFIEYSLEAFRAVLLGYTQNMTKLAQFEESLAEKYNVTNCTAGINAGDAQRLGVRGTPTVVAWSKGYDRLVYITGVRPPSTYAKVFEWLEARAKRG